MTLGTADFIRVPLPAARMTAAHRDWLIDSSKADRITSGGTVAPRRRNYNTQIVAKCILDLRCAVARLFSPTVYQAMPRQRGALSHDAL
jgi:hypothetical protein